MITRHGHHIPDSGDEEKDETVVKDRCGGIYHCDECQADVAAYKKYHTSDVGPYINPDAGESSQTASNKALFRRHAVEFEAVRFTGSNYDELRELTGTRVAAHDGHDIQIFNPIGTYLIEYLYNKEPNPPQAELWVDSAKQWRPVYVGEWIVSDNDEYISVKDEWMMLNCVMLDEETVALIREMERPKTFEEELVQLLNKHSMENFSGTPDWILGEYLRMCLRTWDLISKARSDWRGESVELPALQKMRLDRDRMDRMIAFLRSKVEEGVIDIKEPLEATDLYRELADYQPPEPLDALAGSESMVKAGDHIQAGFEAGLSQGPDEVYAPGSLDDNDGKEVPLVIYTDGQRNEVGTAKVHVTPGEVHVTGTITGAIPQFADPGASYSIGEFEPTSRFDRYQKRGLTENG